MKGITDEFKAALLTDVEQVCEITLTEEQKISLSRCFEITIWHRITPAQRLEAAGMITGVVESLQSSPQEQPYAESSIFRATIQRQ